MVKLVVAVDDWVVVGGLVTVDVADVVGVVTIHSWNPPASNALVMAFSVAAVASQSFESKMAVPNAHPTFSSSPAGPRNSRSAAFNASAVAPQLPVTSTSASMPSEACVLHVISPDQSGSHAASTRFKAAV